MRHTRHSALHPAPGAFGGVWGRKAVQEGSISQKGYDSGELGALGY